MEGLRMGNAWDKPRVWLKIPSEILEDFKHILQILIETE